MYYEGGDEVYEMAIAHERSMMKAKNRSLPRNRLEQWMICREPQTGIYANEPNPKKLYDDINEAKYDAEMLSRQQKIPFYLLKVIAYVQPTPPVVPDIEWVEDE